jgi:hypothetical protein
LLFLAASAAAGDSFTKDDWDFQVRLEAGAGSGFLRTTGQGEWYSAPGVNMSAALYPNRSWGMGAWGNMGFLFRSQQDMALAGDFIAGPAFTLRTGRWVFPFFAGFYFSARPDRSGVEMDYNMGAGAGAGVNFHLSPRLYFHSMVKGAYGFLGGGSLNLSVAAGIGVALSSSKRSPVPPPAPPEPEPEPLSVPEPEPVPQKPPLPKPQPRPKPQPTPQPEPLSVPEPEPEPQKQPEPEPQPEAEPEPAAYSYEQYEWVEPEPSPPPVPVPSLWPEPPRLRPGRSPAVVIPGFPASGVYQVQIGAYAQMQNARAAANSFRNTGYNPVFEWYNGLYRVVLNHIDAEAIPELAIVAGNLGFSEILVRPIPEDR